MASLTSKEIDKDPDLSDTINDLRRLLPPIQGYEEMPIVSLKEAVAPLRSVVPEVERMVRLIQCNCNEPAEGLTKDESASIMLYTIEWEPRENSLHAILNRCLRSEMRWKLTPWFSYLRLLVSALCKLPSKHLTVYRGVDADLSTYYTENTKCVWWGFSPCVFSMNTLDDEFYLGRKGLRTIFIIECDHGKDIRQHSMNKLKSQLLLFPARQFEIVKVFQSNEDCHTIQLRETQPNFPFFNLPATTSSLVTTSQFPLHSTSDNSSNISSMPVKVDLSCQNLTDSDMQHIIQEIIEKKCNELNLASNIFTAEGAKSLAKALSSNTVRG